MGAWGFIKKNREFAAILLIALIARLVFLFSYNEIWWDSGVYAGMGKFIFSLGKSGLWEHIRPVLWPFFLGVLWKLKLDLLFFGRLIELFFSLASVSLLYLIVKDIFDKKTALMAAAIFSFSSVFFIMNFHLYTEIPAVFLVLAGLYLYLKERNFLSGVFMGLAFLMKFPAAVFSMPVFLALIFSKEIKKTAYFCLGIILTAAPFFIINQIAYGNFLLPIIGARESIASVVGCNYLWFKPWHWYFSFIALSENFLHVFSFFGIYHFLKRPRLNKALLFLCLLLPFAYFLQLHCRDYRYLVLIVPFLSIFTAHGINRKIVQREYFMPLLIIVFVLSAILGIAFYSANKLVFENEIQQNYFEFMENREAEGEVWSSNPILAVYSDVKISKAYYPVYDASQSWAFYQYLKKNSTNVEYVFLDSCGGGIICRPEDSECTKNLGYTYNYLKKNFNLVYGRSWGRCRYRIYKK